MEVNNAGESPNQIAEQLKLPSSWERTVGSHDARNPHLCPLRKTNAVCRFQRKRQRPARSSGSSQENSSSRRSGLDQEPARARTASDHESPKTPGLDAALNRLQSAVRPVKVCKRSKSFRLHLAGRSSSMATAIQRIRGHPDVNTTCRAPGAS